MSPSFKRKIKTMTDHTTPEWVNKQLFHELLMQYVDNFKAIVSFAAKSATGQGENYLTIVLRVQITMLLKGTFSSDLLKKV